MFNVSVFKPILIAVVVVSAAAAAAVAASTFRGHTSAYTGVSAYGQVRIAGAAGRMGIVRTHYVIPARWKRLGTLNAPSVTFDTRNSCRHRVTFTSFLVQAADVPATQRAALLIPAAPRYVQAEGTREGAAFRVVRLRGSTALSGVLVQPLSSRAPSGQRIFAEIQATASSDPRRSCHAGGPRTVGDAIGDAFGAGSAGGFASTP